MTPRPRRPTRDADQLSIAAAVAAAVGIDAAKENARDCIQVLGGIGITCQHDAHLYLRLTFAVSQFLGGRSLLAAPHCRADQGPVCDAGCMWTSRKIRPSARSFRAEIAPAAADIAVHCR